MDFLKYITETKLILIPVLYILGMVIKQVSFINDKYIPLVLLIVSIIFNIADTGFSVDSVVQAILVTGATVFTHQLFKQSKEED